MFFDLKNKKNKQFKKFVLKRRVFFKKINYPSYSLASWYKRSLVKFSFFNDSFFFFNNYVVLSLKNTKNFFLNFVFNSWFFFSPLNKKKTIISKQYGFLLSNFLRGLGFWVLVKLKYKGKSFRWYKKKNSLILRFGHSHVVFTTPALREVWWKRKGRMKIIFYGSNIYDLFSYVSNIISWRPMNVYHGRGLRLSKQKVLRKAGKVSAYR